jgi:hypothetical protein
VRDWQASKARSTHAQPFKRRARIVNRNFSMARADSKTTMLADGLRYKSKVSGSPFKAAASFGTATMSCYLCGKHRTRSLMKTRKLLGRAQAVCAPSCKEMDETSAG